MKEMVKFQIFFALINKLITLGSSGRKRSMVLLLALEWKSGYLLFTLLCYKMMTGPVTCICLNTHSPGGFRSLQANFS